MIDHAGFGVAHYERSKAFYERALAPLGITLLMEPMGRGNNVEAVCHKPAGIA